MRYYHNEMFPPITILHTEKYDPYLGSIPLHPSSDVKRLLPVEDFNENLHQFEILSSNILTIFR